MKFFFGIAGFGGMALGLLAGLGASSLVGSIAGLFIMLIGAVFFCAAGILDTLDHHSKLLGRAIQAISVKPAAIIGASLPEKPANSGPAYFLSIDGVDSGPHSLGDVLALWKSKRLKPVDLVYRNDETAWMTGSQFAEIMEL